MQAWGLTDPGCVRVQNQDAYGVHTFEEDSLLCTVCQLPGFADIHARGDPPPQARDEPGAGRADVPGSGASGQFYRL